MDRTVVGVVAGAAAAVSWGVMFPIAAVALPHVDPFLMTAIRYGGGAIVLLAILALREGPAALHTDGQALQLILLGTAGFAGFTILLYIGLQTSSVQHAALLVAIAPVMTTAALALITRRAPSPLAMAALALALFGVFIVITKGKIDGLVGSSAGVGDLWIALGVMCWVVYTIGSARFKTWSPLRFTALSAAAGGLASILAAAIAVVLGAAHIPSAATLVAYAPHLAYMVVVAAVFAVLAFNTAIQNLGPRSAMLFMNLVPVTAFAIAAASGAHTEVAEYVGAILALSGLLLNNVAARRADGAAASAVVQPGFSAPRTRA